MEDCIRCLINPCTIDVTAKNLYEQFRRLANFYFLALVVVQCVPYFNVASPLFAAAPILFIVMITGRAGRACMLRVRARVLLESNMCARS